RPGAPRQPARHRAELAARRRGRQLRARRGRGPRYVRGLQLPRLLHDQSLAVGPRRGAGGEPRPQAHAAQGRDVTQSRSARHTHEGLRPTCAVIDIGSNTVRLVVYRGSRRAPDVWLNERVVARLGRDLAPTGRLPGKAIDEALAALARYATILRDHGIDD